MALMVGGRVVCAHAHSLTQLQPLGGALPGHSPTHHFSGSSSPVCVLQSPSGQIVIIHAAVWFLVAVCRLLGAVALGGLGRLFCPALSLRTQGLAHTGSPIKDGNE